MGENMKVSNRDEESLAVKFATGDPTGLKMTGQITDRIYKNGVLIEERVGHNIIVNSFLKLVMALCKGDSSYKGIQYWAIGSGETTWDSYTPEPEINATRLTRELGRVEILPSDIVFLDQAGTIVSSPSNIIQIAHVFGPYDCNGEWREFGIFGGDATSVANSGVMINKKHHALITKTSEMSVERTMKFTLNLV